MVMQKIASKLVKIMQETAYVQKNGVNEFHKYKYVTSADVLEKINKAFTKYGIISVATPELMQLEEVKTSKGNLERLAMVKLEILLVDIDSGESLKITGLGSGQDAGDKAVMKAQTAAIKYAYLLSLAISVGDDPETEQNASAEDERIQMETPSLKVESKCMKCGVALTKGVVAVSMKKYGKAFCIKCQKIQGNC